MEQRGHVMELDVAIGESEIDGIRDMDICLCRRISVVVGVGEMVGNGR